MRKISIGIAISTSLLAFSAQAQAPAFTAAGVLNAASMVAGPIAPGMVVTITGTSLGDPSFPGNCINVTPTPATCSAVAVLVNGGVAPKIYDSATQLTFQAPFNLTGSSATIQVTSSLSGSTLSSGVVTVPVAPVAPALFTCSTGNCASGTGYYYDESQSGLGAQYSRAVQLGDTVVLFGTGFGATNPAVATGVLGPTPGAGATAGVTMTINNQSVPVTFAGLEPGSFPGAAVGYDEVVFTVPATLTVPTGQASASFPVVVTVGGVASPSVNLIVASPGVRITSTNPNPVPLYANAQTVTFIGTGFQPGLTLALQSPSKQTIFVPSSDVTYVSATQFIAQITVGTAPGSWGAVVTNTDGDNSDEFLFTPVTVTPTISYIVTTSSGSTQISQNTWIEVHGNYLSVAGPLTWSNSDFSKGLPTTLAGVSATVNGMPAAIFYASSTQLNILSPLDSTTGPVPVALNTPLGPTAATMVTEAQLTPAFLVIDGASHVAAQHLPSFSLLGPSSLSQPGYTYTPAHAGESVTIYATGFGQTSPALTNQIGNTGLSGNNPFPLSLPTLPSVTIGNLPAVVSFAGLASPGLYQINLTVPAGAQAGDLPIVATYNGASTQAAAVITVQ